jgi:hypothetical protein
MYEKLLLMYEQGNGFLKMTSLGEETVNTVKMTTNDLGFYITLIDKLVAEFEGIGSIFFACVCNCSLNSEN